jgi:hypothetical protein
LVQKNARIILYNTSARTTLTCGSDAWSVCKQDESGIIATEMKFMIAAGYTPLDYKNLDIMKELNAQPITEATEYYRTENPTFLEFPT